MRLDRGVAQELPYPDGSFDRVFSSLMLHHLDSPSKDALLAEAGFTVEPTRTSALRIGGKVGIEVARPSG